MTYCCVIVEPPWETRAAADVLPRGAGDADGIDAAVFEEVAVLGGEHGLDEDVGHLLEGDVDPVLLVVQAGHGVVLGAALIGGHVGGADEGRLGLEPGRGQLDLGEHETGPGHEGDEQQTDEEQAPPPPPQEAALRRRHRGPAGGDPPASKAFGAASYRARERAGGMARFGFATRSGPAGEAY